MKKKANLPDDYEKLWLRTVMEWTPEKLLETRERLGLPRTYIADIFGVSPCTIKNLEFHKIRNPLAVMAYGTVLERYQALKKGYIPAYRKIGKSEFMKEGL